MYSALKPAKVRPRPLRSLRITADKEEIKDLPKLPPATSFSRKTIEDLRILESYLYPQSISEASGDRGGVVESPVSHSYPTKPELGIFFAYEGTPRPPATSEVAETGSKHPKTGEDFWRMDPFDEPPSVEEGFSNSTAGYGVVLFDPESETICCAYVGRITVRRVSASRLGYGVLGRAFCGYNLVEVLDDLTGNDFIEVLTHETFHIEFPWMTEYGVRQLTRQALPFAPRFH